MTEKEKLDSARERLEEIQGEIQELCEEALSLLPKTGMIRERARSYWYAHILAATGGELYLNRHDTTISTTLRELERLSEDSEELSRGIVFESPEGGGE